MKTCSVCRQSLPSESFAKGRAMCRDCKRERYRESRKEGDRKYRVENRERLNAIKREWAKHNPRPRTEQPLEKTKAWQLVGTALRNGSLERPESCEECGRTGTRIHAHHDDYSQPLNVRWLCAACHQYLHAHEGVAA